MAGCGSLPNSTSVGFEYRTGWQISQMWKLNRCLMQHPVVPGCFHSEEVETWVRHKQTVPLSSRGLMVSMDGLMTYTATASIVFLSFSLHSLSEPSLLTPKENNIFAEFSSNSRHGVSQKRTLPSPSFGKSWSPFKTCHPSGTSKSHLQQNHRRQVESCSRPTYIHFSQAIQPNSKPKPARHISHNQALNSEMAQGDRRALAMQIPNSSSKSEPLSVIGKPCLLNCSHGPVMAATPGSGRTQLHVFLPTEEEGEREGEEVDCESVDEGFMDELDSKITSLKLQQGAPKTVTYHWRKEMTKLVLFTL